MNKLEIVALILLTIGFMLFFGGIILQGFLNCEKEKIVKTDCFDKYGNKINDVTCDEVTCIQENSFSSHLLLIGLLTMILSVILQGINILRYKDET